MAIQQIADLDPAEHELRSSDLDPETHGEMLHLYAESATSIRFAKSQQWMSLGATLVVFAALMALGMFVPERSGLVKSLVLASFLISAGSLYTLVLYQAWQNTERTRLRSISTHLSSLAQEIRAIKSSREANVHRYTLLAFMIISVLLGNAFTVAVLMPLYQ